MSKKTILVTLEQGLLHGAAMSATLCKAVLMNELDEFEASLREDGDDALIALVAEKHEMALLLIDKTGAVYRNEAAREQLQRMWLEVYTTNVQTLLPIFVADLNRGMLSVAGVKWVSTPV